MKLKQIEIDDLAKFKETDNSKLAIYGVSKALADIGLSEDGEDLFGDPIEEIYVCEKDVIADNIVMEGTGGVFVIDGNLNIKKNMIFFGSDAYSILVVKGNLTVEDNLLLLEDVQLIVLGNTIVKDSLWLNFSDAGFGMFRGSLESKTYCQYSDTEATLNKEIVGIDITGNDYDENIKLLEEKFGISDYEYLMSGRI
jgi:hypothetical protein